MSKVLTFSYCFLVMSLGHSAFAAQLVEQWITKPIVQAPDEVVELKFCDRTSEASGLAIRTKSNRLMFYEGASLRNEIQLNQKLPTSTPALDRVLNSASNLVADQNCCSEDAVNFYRLPTVSGRFGARPTPTKVPVVYPISELHWSPLDSAHLLVKTEGAESYFFRVKNVVPQDRWETVATEKVALPRISQFKFFSGGMIFFAEGDANLALGIASCRETCALQTFPVPVDLQTVTEFSYTEICCLPPWITLFDSSTGMLAAIVGNTGRLMYSNRVSSPGSIFLAYSGPRANSEAILIRSMDAADQYLVFDTRSGNLIHSAPAPAFHPSRYSFFPIGKEVLIVGKDASYSDSLYNFGDGSLADVSKKKFSLSTAPGSQLIQFTKRGGNLLFVTPHDPSDSEVKVFGGWYDFGLQSSPNVISRPGVFDGARLLEDHPDQKFAVAGWKTSAGQSSSVIVQLHHSSSVDSFPVSDSKAHLSSYGEDGFYFVTNENRLKRLTLERN